jgi:hypothetical protein
MFFFCFSFWDWSHLTGDYSPDLIDNNPDTPLYDFDNPIYHAKEEGAEDCDLLELAKLLRQEEKVIQPLEGRFKICYSKLRRGQKVKVEAASETSQEQSGSPVERAVW